MASQICDFKHAVVFTKPAVYLYKFYIMEKGNCDSIAKYMDFGEYFSLTFGLFAH